MMKSLITSLLFIFPLSCVRAQSNAVDHYAPRQVLPRALRAITDPPIVRANEATIGGNELVIGVDVGGEARAYSINQLTGPSREIINDRLGGIAIAATW